MAENESAFKMELDHDEFRNHVQDSIKSVVTAMVKSAMPHDGLESMLKSAFEKSWMRDKGDNWIEGEARSAMHQAIWQSVREAIDESDIKSMVNQATNEMLKSDEFRAALVENTRKAVMETTFRVKAGYLDPDDDQS